MKVSGNSMNPRLLHGDILIIDPERSFGVRSGGRTGVIKYDEEYCIRKIHINKDGEHYLLEPLNKAYDSEVIPVEGTEIFKIVEVRSRGEGEF